MTTIFKGNLTDARTIVDALKTCGLYSTLSGHKASGYEVLVRDEIVGACKETGALKTKHAGGDA